MEQTKQKINHSNQIRVNAVKNAIYIKLADGRIYFANKESFIKSFLEGKNYHYLNESVELKQ